MRAGWRKRSDKAAWVERFLTEPLHRQLSDREVARRCGVSHQLVARVRQAQGTKRQTGPCVVRRGGAVYAMRTCAINARRATVRDKARLESQEPGAVELRRQVAQRAYEAMRARVASFGALTPAGWRCLERDWRRMNELERLDREVRGTGLAFVQGKPATEALFHAAIAACERAWAETIGTLRRAQERR